MAYPSPDGPMTGLVALFISVALFALPVFVTIGGISLVIDIVLALTGEQFVF